MRIMIHSNGPMVPTGYGNQVRLLLPLLRDMGHDVAVSAFYGVAGSPIDWNGFTILPAGMSNFGLDTIIPHALEYGADLVITLMDFWKLNAAARAFPEQPFQLAAWLPNDCTPLGKPDHATLSVSGAHPIAMSHFGADNLVRAGFQPSYIPHMVDTEVFQPSAERNRIRCELGLDGKFVVGILAANRDALRKAWPEQFAAFARFHGKHPTSHLMVHATGIGPTGLDLPQLIGDFGLEDCVTLSDQYAQVAGLFTTAMQADWYNALDVLSLCSYAEAFGVPILEAQACGTPVIATKGSAMEELTLPGLQVSGSQFWNPVHRAWWTRPDVDRIIGKYEKVHRDAGTPRMVEVSEAGRLFAQEFAPAVVAKTYWEPFLARVQSLIPR